MAVTKRPNGRWQATYKDPARREQSKIFDRRVDADRWLTTQQSDVIRGTWVDPKAGRQTLREYAPLRTGAQQWRPATRQRVESTLELHILPALASRPLGALRRSEIQSFVNGLDMAPNTVHTVFQHLRTLLGAAVEDGLLVRSPAVGVHLPGPAHEPVVPLTAAQVWTLVDAAPERLRAAVIAGAGLGLRQGEMLGLTVDRVDSPRTVRIDRQLAADGSFAPPKTRAAYRTIPASAVVLDALSALLAAFGEGLDGRLFHYTRTGFAKAWVGTVAEMPGVRFHDLRHAFASTLIAQGCSVKSGAGGDRTRVGGDDARRLLALVPGRPRQHPARCAGHPAPAGRGIEAERGSG